MATIVMIDNDGKLPITKTADPKNKWEIVHADYNRWMWWPTDEVKGLPLHKCSFKGFDYKHIAADIRYGQELYKLYEQAPSFIITNIDKEFYRPIIKAADWFAYYEVAFGRQEVPKKERKNIQTFSKVQYLVDSLDTDVTSGTSYQYPEHKLAGILCIDEGHHTSPDTTGHFVLSHPDGFPCRHTEIWEDGDVPISPHTGNLFLWPGDTIFHYVKRDTSKIWVQVLIS
jgi:hypothetical protein